jgi:hypothetical protein
VRNFYKVLGVATTADDQRIKTAFRRRVKTVHPDLNPGNRRAEARFIELRQAYEALTDARTRVAYDAYLADQRSQSRRRFAHCAGLMMTSFVLTAASAIFVMSLAGANVPFRQTWQLAVAALAPASSQATAAQKGGQTDAGWTTQVAVASESPAPPDRVDPAQNPKTEPGRELKGDPLPLAAPHKPPAAKARQSWPDAPGNSAKGSRQQVATAPKQAPAAVKRPDPAPAYVTPEESWPPAPPPSDEPRYSLGASDLR